MAIQEYKRSMDDTKLVQDGSVEITTVFYPPTFESISDADVGNSDTNKVGALATFKDGSKTKLAVYQGNGVWIVAGGGDLESINEESISFDQTSASLNSSYPDMPIGGTVYSNTNNVVYTKKTPTRWVMGSLI